MTRRPLDGQVVVVTGAAQGIGAATCRLLAAKGAVVVLVDRDGPLVDETARSIDGRAHAFVADVTDRTALSSVFDTIAAELGGIDAVVANAGIVGPVATMGAIDPDAFEAVIEVNLLGVWNTIRAALPHVRARGGYVLLISSAAATIPCPTIAAYGASKAGVEALGRALEIELADTGCRAGVAYFGLIDTGLVRDGLFGGTGLDALLTMLPGWLIRSAPAEDAAGAIVPGIERRSRAVYAPSWVRVASALRPVIRACDALVARHPAIRAAIASADTPAATAQRLAGVHS